MEAHTVFMGSNIIIISMLPRATYRFNTILIKIPITYFTELEQIFQNFIWNHKRPHIAMTILRKKNIIGGMMLSIKLHYKVIVIKRAWYGHKTDTRSMEWNREPQNKPTHLQSINIWQRKQARAMSCRQFIQ